MVTVVNRGPNLSADFGTGIGRGLEALAQSKLNDIQQRRNQTQQQQVVDNLKAPFAQYLQTQGYDAPTVNMITSFPQESWLDVLAHVPSPSTPEAQDLGQLLQQLGPNIQEDMQQYLQEQQAPQSLIPAAAPLAMQQQQQPIQQPQPKQIAIEKQTKQPTFSQSVKAAKGAKESTPAQQQHMDTLNQQLHILDDTVDTTQRMLDTLNNNKINVGVMSDFLARRAPSWLDKQSELFDKDAAHIVNLASANLKGVPSKFRVQLIEKEKPGLQHSIPVNKQILTRMNEQAKEARNSLTQRYPTLEQNKQQPIEEKRSTKEFSELPPASQYKGKKIRGKTSGKIFVSNGSDWKEQNAK